MNTFTPEQTRLLLFFSALIILFCVETLWPCRRWEDRRLSRVIVHGFLSILNAVTMRLLVAAPLAAWISFVQSQQWGLLHSLGWLGPGGVLLTLLVLDLFDYWWHRWNHEVALLWRFHRVHHTDTHLDVTTALRFHIGELLLSALVKAVWILIWGPSLWGFALFEAMITTAALFHHSNLDLPPRWENVIWKLLVTPRFHTSHHTVTPRTREANYSTVIILWDKIFGTFRYPDPVEMKALGLPQDRENHLKLGTILVSPLQKLK